MVTPDLEKSLANIYDNEEVLNYTVGGGKMDKEDLRIQSDFWHLRNNSFLIGRVILYQLVLVSLSVNALI